MNLNINRRASYLNDYDFLETTIAQVDLLQDSLDLTIFYLTAITVTIIIFIEIEQIILIQIDFIKEIAMTELWKEIAVMDITQVSKEEILDSLEIKQDIKFKIQKC